jgi:hypothetical protein
MSGDLFGDPVVTAPQPEPVKWTERMMLDLLSERYTKDAGNGPRWIYAEHVRSEAGFGRFDYDLFKANGKRTTLRTADAIAVDLWPSGGNEIHGFEVKVSRTDWLTELRDPTKADAVRRYCHRWWLVVPDVAIVRDGLPEGWGLLAVGSDGKLRVRHQAPQLTPTPTHPSFLAALLRSAVRTAERGAQ